MGILTRFGATALALATSCAFAQSAPTYPRCGMGRVYSAADAFFSPHAVALDASERSRLLAFVKNRLSQVDGDCCALNHWVMVGYADRSEGGAMTAHSLAGHRAGYVEDVLRRHGVRKQDICIVASPAPPGWQLDSSVPLTKRLRVEIEVQCYGLRALDGLGRIELPGCR